MKIQFPQIEIDKDIFKVIINYADLNIDKKKIGLVIGYSNGELPPHFEEMIDQVISQLSNKCEIHSGYRLIDLHHSLEKPDGLFVGPEFFKMDKISEKTHPELIPTE